MPGVVQEDILGFEVAIDDAIGVQVLEAARDLGGVEERALLFELSLHVVDVELEVAAVHEREYETERVFDLVGVGEAHDEARVELLQDELLV